MLFSKIKPHIAASDIDKTADPGRANATGNPDPSATAIVNISINKNKSSKILTHFYFIYL